MVYSDQHTDSTVIGLYSLRDAAPFFRKTIFSREKKGFQTVSSLIFLPKNMHFSDVLYIVSHLQP